MLNPVNASVPTATHKVAAGLNPALDKPDIKSSALSQVDGKSDTARVSTLARQLAESAVRAEAREKEMSREQLGAYAMKMQDQIFGPSGSEAKARYAAEVPKTDDPELLERARQSTLYVTRTIHGDVSVKNPFTDLTREQTALIAYDDAGPYTRHEREAAFWHGLDLEQQWRVSLFARANQESAQFGSRVGFYTECLVHYKGLPAVEQAEYNAGYETRLLTDIARESEGLKPTDRLLTLFEVLARMGLPEFKKKHEGPTADEGVQATSKPPAATKEAALTKPAAENPTPVTEPTTVKTSSLSPGASPNQVAVERSQPCRAAR